MLNPLAESSRTDDDDRALVVRAQAGDGRDPHVGGAADRPEGAPAQERHRQPRHEEHHAEDIGGRDVECRPKGTVPLDRLREPRQVLEAEAGRGTEGAGDDDPSDYPADQSGAAPVRAVRSHARECRAPGAPTRATPR
jgi:hypothetical protein